MKINRETLFLILSFIVNVRTDYILELYNAPGMKNVRVIFLYHSANYMRCQDFLGAGGFFRKGDRVFLGGGLPAPPLLRI